MVFGSTIVAATLQMILLVTHRAESTYVQVTHSHKRQLSHLD